MRKARESHLGKAVMPAMLVPLSEREGTGQRGGWMEEGVGLVVGRRGYGVG